MSRPRSTAAEIAAALRAQHASATSTLPPALAETAQRRERGDEAPVPAIDHQRTVAFFRWYEGLLRAHGAAADAVARRNLDDTVHATDDDDDVRAAVHGIHGALLRHPVAAKAIVAALVAEGRKFAATPEGGALQQRLTASRRVRRATVLWRSVTLGLLDCDDGDALPRMYLDTLLQLVDSAQLEETLARLVAELGGPR